MVLIQLLLGIILTIMKDQYIHSYFIDLYFDLLSHHPTTIKNPQKYRHCFSSFLYLFIKKILWLVQLIFLLIIVQMVQFIPFRLSFKIIEFWMIPNKEGQISINFFAHLHQNLLHSSSIQYFSLSEKWLLK